MDYDLEIEFEKAEQSIENDRGLAAHYKASADEKQRLLDLARQEKARADQLQKLLAVTQSQNIQLQHENQRLQSRVAELEARPVSVTADKYFENYNVAHQVVTLQPRPTTKRLKSKNKYIDTNQLDIWKDNPAISW